MARNKYISPLRRPYVAPPSARSAAQLQRCYERRIAYGVQMRGDSDDLPVLIYYGAPFQLLYDVMSFVGKCMGDGIKGYRILHEHSCRWKNGKAYRRLAVEIYGLNEGFMSLSSLLLVINNYMQRICWCTVKEMPLRKLLNL